MELHFASSRYAYRAESEQCEEEMLRTNTTCKPIYVYAEKCDTSPHNKIGLLKSRLGTAKSAQTDSSDYLTLSSRSPLPPVTLATGRCPRSTLRGPGRAGLVTGEVGDFVRSGQPVIYIINTC